MPLRLFRTETSRAAQRERREQLEKGVVEAFRVISKLFDRAAGLIERQRLERNGYQQQEQFLERSKPKDQT